MRVPKYIQDKMHRVVALQRQSNALMWEIEEWLRRNGIDPYDVRDGRGDSLEELEYGNDVVFELIMRLERTEENERISHTDREDRSEKG